MKTFNSDDCIAKNIPFSDSKSKSNGINFFYEEKLIVKAFLDIENFLKDTK